MTQPLQYPRRIEFTPFDPDHPQDPVDIELRKLRDELARLEGAERGWSQVTSDIAHDSLEARAHLNKAQGEAAAWSARLKAVEEKKTAAEAERARRLERLAVLKPKIEALAAGQREERRRREAAEAEERARQEAEAAAAKERERQEWLAKQPERDAAAAARREQEAARAAQARTRVEEVAVLGEAALHGGAR